MIVTRVDGGLGNQFFQVAYGMQLAWKHGTELVLDLSSYRNQPAHGLLLNQFCIDARALSDSEQRLLPARYRSVHEHQRSSSWLEKLSGLWQHSGLTRVREKPFGFDERYLSAADNSYLVGYWQSEKFFPDVRTQVRQSFRLSSSLSKPAARLFDRMHSGSSIAIHVRRGDYVSNPQAAAIYRQLSVEYYQRCVDDWLEANPHSQAIIFSNDIAWCQQNLAFPCPVTLVTSDVSAGAHEDLWLMTAAQAVVTANSTFSWWGGWLSQHRHVRVYTPRQWFYPRTLSDRDLPAEGWQLVDDRQALLSAA